MRDIGSTDDPVSTTGQPPLTPDGDLLAETADEIETVVAR